MRSAGWMNRAIAAVVTPALAVTAVLAARAGTSETKPVAPPQSTPAPASAAAPPASPTGSQRWNVVLVSIDSLRWDMPWNGYPRDIAPRLTAFEKRSVSFTRAYAISSFTSKSVGGLLGGTWPSAMKRDGEFFTRYDAANVLFPELLHDAGVTTLAGQAHNYLDRASGLVQGFDAWKLVPGITFDYNKDPWITSQKLTPLAISMIDEAAKKPQPFFAWFHFMDPHDVYQPHPEQPSFGGRPRDLYDGEVLYTDGWVGKLVDWIEAQPFAAHTAIVVTADHGEGFGEHRVWRHAHELYDVLVKVPMFALVPGVAPRRIDVPRSHVDLAPTVLELAGVPVPATLPGTSLAGEILRGAPAEPRPVVCDLPEDAFNERRRALIDGDWKLIALANDFRYQLYDLKNDPGETKDLFKEQPDRARAMVAAYKAMSAKIPEQKVPGGIKKHRD